MTRSGNQSQNQFNENYGERIARLEERVGHVQDSVACLAKKVTPMAKNLPLWEHQFAEMIARITHIESLVSTKTLIKIGMGILIPILVATSKVSRVDIGDLLLAIAGSLK